MIVNKFIIHDNIDIVDHSSLYSYLFLFNKLCI